jgi:hypothetical protein
MTHRCLAGTLVLAFATGGCATRVGQITIAGSSTPGTDVCEVVDFSKTIKVDTRMGKDHPDKLRALAWVVVNQCDPISVAVLTRNVAVGNFLRNGQAATPIEDCTASQPTGPKSRKDAIANDNTDITTGQIGIISCRVKACEGKDCSKEVYKYSIYIDGTLKKDPEVIIKR